MPKGHASRGGYVGSGGTYISGGKFSANDTVSSESWGFVTSGLTLHLDAGNTASYPGYGNTWYDLSANKYNFTIEQGAFNYGNGVPYMDFSGSNGMAKRSINNVLTDVPAFSNATVMMFTAVKPETTDWRTFLRGSPSAADHQIIIEYNTNRLGMHDNQGAGYLDSGFAINTIPNYSTKFNCLTWKLGQSSPYYQFSYNGGSVVGTITNSSATFTNGFSAIFGYHGESAIVTDGSQYAGKLSVLLYYNRYLTDAEIAQNYSAFRTRYGV